MTKMSVCGADPPTFSAEAPYSWGAGDATVPAGGTATTEVLAAPRIYPRSDVGFYAQNLGSPPSIVSIDPAGPATHSGLVVVIGAVGEPDATVRGRSDLRTRRRSRAAATRRSLSRSFAAAG